MDPAQALSATLQCGAVGAGDRRKFALDPNKASAQRRVMKTVNDQSSRNRPEELARRCGERAKNEGRQS
jgi:hypothetical protein